MEFTVGQIAQLVQGTVAGDASAIIRSAAKIEEGTPGCISFLSNLKYEPFLYTTGSTAVLVDESFEPKKQVETTLIYVKNAYTAFTLLLEEYQKATRQARRGIEQPCHIGQTSSIGEDAYRGAFSYIGEYCTLGNRVKIYPNTYIGNNVQIGNDTVIHPGVRIYDNTIIGNHCTIFANSVIGSDGFGFAPQADGTYRAIPQLGNVVIEDHVSIGSNTTIDCATMGSTVIRSGVKIDNLVQIAHNVEIGKNTVIAAQTGISGSTKIGEQCVIAGQVGISGHISLANHTKVGAQSGVGKSIKKEGLSLSGSPAYDLSAHLRAQVHVKKLPELEKRIQNLENERIRSDKNTHQL
ncbi:UDP-3-O-(3-hydroxymyristoyl)glucosamine N-acyltransferase [Arundinibacter roseus]|uniref:UDP-3-O-acylglucosamine N-acyltransferase n=1 Tax=Arundinibacter roseus TaxID=2070510 RepID=A0A4R4K5G5_9BACT|nr:UDP-3-O-(3-hydroxymyristoyl)glucosamine N-acyltransferase [Arundinibacter roseus]TDB61419.1 UDP-3-O-(3-hydroxymyristoyl)glucosamine N-acyltransferase [Arundinibacter roseus]